MTATSIILAALSLVLLQAAPAQRATVAPQAFAGTWVGTQSWAIDAPPPGARQDQPVSLTIDVVDGRIIGTMTPFMGGQDGASFVESEIVGDELRATAVVGAPRLPAPGGRGRRAAGPPPGWKNGIKIQFAFKNDGTAMTGTADVTLNDVKWLKFNYDLSKKRLRY
jgi:hypothetical protein